MSEAETAPALIKALARARGWFDDLAPDRVTSLTALARLAGVSPHYVARLLPLAYLAPVTVEAIVAGHPPPGLTAEQLTRRLTLLPDWSEQQRVVADWAGVATS